MSSSASPAERQSLTATFTQSAVPILWSWWAVVVLFAVVNYKAMPGVWTVRAVYNLNAGLGRGKRETKPSPTEHNSKRRVAIIQKTIGVGSILEHPLFRPEILSTHVPLLEVDFNVHKSNSTYFTDLDVARIRLVGRIMAPAWPLDDMPIEYKGRDGTMKREKVRGRAALILGATYTAFKRELKALASYDVESRVIAWDTRWIYIASWFVSKKKVNGKGTQLYASSLSKYIVKKGRITVQPEQFLTESGWIPARPPVEVGKLPAEKTLSDDGELSQLAKPKDRGLDPWTWDEVEAERVRGLAVVDKWGDTDTRLEKEYLGET